MARGALWYDFNEPYATATAPEVRVFDWSTNKCGDDDIPDQPARAFRDSSGQVSLIDSHHTVRRALGSTLGTVSTSAADSCSRA